MNTNTFDRKFMGYFFVLRSSDSWVVKANTVGSETNFD